MTDSKFLVDNFYFRMDQLGLEASQGRGSTSPSLLVIQDDESFAETRIVLKHMGLIEHSFITPVDISMVLSYEENLKYLRELTELLKPMLVVAAGSISVMTLRDSISKQFSMSKYRGRPFISSCLDTTVFPVYLPKEHVDPKSNKRIRSSAKKDWSTIKSQLVSLKTEEICKLWDLSSNEAQEYVYDFFNITT